MSNADNKFRVLFVCTGNTCRSPMARVMLEHELTGELARRVAVDSAGVVAADGAQATPAAVDAVAAHGVDLSQHRSKRLTRDLAASADLVLTMEERHRQAVVQLLGDEDAGHVHALHAFEAEPDSEDVPIHDPFGGSAEIYAECLSRIRGHLERVRHHLELRAISERH